MKVEAEPSWPEPQDDEVSASGSGSGSFSDHLQNPNSNKTVNDDGQGSLDQGEAQMILGGNLSFINTDL